MDRVFQFLENLRTRPEGQRRRIAFFSTLVLAVVMIVIWFSVFSPVGKNKTETAKDEAGSNVASPFQNISEQFANLKSLFGGLK